jgi:hypothetical protein
VPLKIFHVATDFIVAENIEAAKKFYVEMTGETDADYLAEVDGEAQEVPEADWPNMTIVDVDTKGHPKQTFREAFDDMLTWENQEYPKVIASSEY